MGDQDHKFPGDHPALTAQETAILTEFRTAVNAKFAEEKDTFPYPNSTSDETLVRYLRAKRFEVADAMTKYTEWREWVIRKKVLDLRTVKPPNCDKLQRLYGCSIRGTDREGHPVLIERMGGAHMPSFRKLTNASEWETFHIWQMEQLAMRIEEQRKILGKPIHKATFITDLAGLGMEHRHGVEFFAAASVVDEKYYCETVARVFVVNAPWVFPSIYGLVKHFIDPDTRTKIEVLSGSPADYTARLQEFIAPDQLPKAYGGTATWEVPPCEHEALLEEIEDLGLQKLEIPAGQKRQIEVTTSAAGVIGWYTRTIGHDIEFEAEFVPEKGGIIPLVAKNRASLHQGSFPVLHKGTAYLTFSNTFSYLRGKTLEYSVSFSLVAE